MISTDHECKLETSYCPVYRHRKVCINYTIDYFYPFKCFVVEHAQNKLYKNRANLAL